MQPHHYVAMHYQSLIWTVVVNLAVLGIIVAARHLVPEYFDLIACVIAFLSILLKREFDAGTLFLPNVQRQYVQHEHIGRGRVQF